MSDFYCLKTLPVPSFAPCQVRRSISFEQFQYIWLPLVYLYSQCGGSESSEATIRVLLPGQAGHGTAHEVDEAAVAVVLHHAAKGQDHHRDRV